MREFRKKIRKSPKVHRGYPRFWSENCPELWNFPKIRKSFFVSTFLLLVLSTWVFWVPLHTTVSENPFCKSYRNPSIWRVENKMWQQFRIQLESTRIHFGGQSAHSSIRLLAPIDSPVRSLAPIDRGTRTNKAANHVHRPHPSALRHLFETLCLLIQNKK